MPRLSNSQRQVASEPPGKDNGKRRCKPSSQKLINRNASVGQKSPTTNDLANVGIYLTIFLIVRQAPVAYHQNKSKYKKVSVLLI